MTATVPSDASVSLFSYGTLQQPDVQIATFGRPLKGQADVLTGHILQPLQITDPAVIATSGASVHTIAIPARGPDEPIPGVVFKITPGELASADSYEVDAVRREVRLASGRLAFAYLGKEAS